MGDKFPLLRSTCLQQYPPSRNRKWAEKLSRMQREKDFIGFGRNRILVADLEPDDIACYELDWTRLGAAIARAFAIRGEYADVGLPDTKQIGLIRGRTLPVFLTVQGDALGGEVAKLVLRWPQGLVLFAPTNRCMDANTLALLGSKAAFFDLRSSVNITGDGELVARPAAKEAFARFEARPMEAEGVEAVAEAAASVPALAPAPEPKEPEPEEKPGRPPLVVEKEAGAVSPTGKAGPRYLLRKGAGIWRLVFNGAEGEIHDGRGIALVAYLLFNPPPGGVHGTELASLVFGSAVVQEASLGADGDATRKLIQKEAQGAMAVLTNPLSSEMEKNEAKDELQNLAKALNVTRKDSEGSVDQQVRAIRRAIDRLIDKLREATDRKKNPHRALRDFGEHLHKFLWIPSSRFSGDRRARARAEVAGHFTYERPNGVVWEE